MIKYVIGDATEPQGDDNKLIIHCCNDIGAWGAGFVVALSKKWPEPEARYRSMFEGGAVAREPAEYLLGHVQYVPVSSDTTVANLIGQHGISDAKTTGVPEFGTRPPIRYDAIWLGLARIARHYRTGPSAFDSVHMPRMGSGLAGGDWRVIEALIESTLGDAGIPVTVYDLQHVT